MVTISGNRIRSLIRDVLLKEDRHTAETPSIEQATQRSATSRQSWEKALKISFLANFNPSNMSGGDGAIDDRSIFSGIGDAIADKLDNARLIGINSAPEYKRELQRGLRSPNPDAGSYDSWVNGTLMRAAAAWDCGNTPRFQDRNTNITKSNWLECFEERLESVDLEDVYDEFGWDQPDEVDTVSGRAAADSDRPPEVQRDPNRPHPMNRTDALRYARERGAPHEYRADGSPNVRNEQKTEFPLSDSGNSPLMLRLADALESATEAALERVNQMVRTSDFRDGFARLAGLPTDNSNMGRAFKRAWPTALADLLEFINDDLRVHTFFEQIREAGNVSGGQGAGPGGSQGRRGAWMVVHLHPAGAIRNTYYSIPPEHQGSREAAEEWAFGSSRNGSNPSDGSFWARERPASAVAIVNYWGDEEPTYLESGQNSLVNKMKAQLNLIEEIGFSVDAVTSPKGSLNGQSIGSSFAYNSAKAARKVIIGDETPESYREKAYATILHELDHSIRGKLFGVEQMVEGQQHGILHTAVGVGSSFLDSAFRPTIVVVADLLKDANMPPTDIDPSQVKDRMMADMGKYIEFDIWTNPKVAWDLLTARDPDKIKTYDGGEGGDEIEAWSNFVYRMSTAVGTGQEMAQRIRQRPIDIDSDDEQIYEQQIGGPVDFDVVEAGQSGPVVEGGWVYMLGDGEAQIRGTRGTSAEDAEQAGTYMDAQPGATAGLGGTAAVYSGGQMSGTGEARYMHYLDPRNAHTQNEIYARVIVTKEQTPDKGRQIGLSGRYNFTLDDLQEFARQTVDEIDAAGFSANASQLALIMRAPGDMTEESVDAFNGVGAGSVLGSGSLIARADTPDRARLEEVREFIKLSLIHKKNRGRG